MRRVKTEDAVPLWDYDAPDTPQTPRDASAAAITASALIELSTLVEDGQAYMEYAGKLLKSLSSDGYLAKPEPTGACTDAFNGLIAERFRNRYAGLTMPIIIIWRHCSVICR